MNKERTAIKLALNLLASDNWNGDDDFSRGMKILQKTLIKKSLTKRPKPSTILKQCN